MSAIRTLIVGTAGHIDHGKSSVVRALTGVDPDRLIEEQERGMTIDLGFAPYTHAGGETVGIIDVPGHERFIRNMVAGATSIDVVMLVVAADDGIMPQTREHLEILSLLGVERGLVVLNKIDLVETELRELAHEELSDFVRGTFLEGAPVVETSMATGAGLVELRATLDGLLSQATPHGDEGPFRLPVQRVFSAKGHGLVVTGVPISGKVQVGDRLELVRQGSEVRVRGIQAYGETREVGRAGHSLALNLAGASREDVHRGDVVAAPGSFRAARFLAVAYEHVHGENALRSQHFVRLHVGTTEVLGHAVLLDEQQRLERGGRGPVQVRLDEAVTAAPGDRLLLRDAAAMALLGGGTVLALTDGRLKRAKERVLVDLRARREALGDPVRLARAAVGAAGPRGRRLAELAVEVGQAPDHLAAELAPLVATGELVRAAHDIYVADEALEVVAQDLLAALRAEHDAKPLLDWLELKHVRQRTGHADAVLEVVLARERGLETAPGGRVRRKGHRGRLTEGQRAARERVLALLAEAGPTPPAVDAALTGLSERETAALLEMMRKGGEIVAVGSHLFHREALERMRELLVAHGRAHGGEIDIPALRDELGTSRKYLIPLLEHFDAQGLTARHGERRVLRQRDAEG